VPALCNAVLRLVTANEAGRAQNDNGEWSGKSSERKASELCSATLCYAVLRYAMLCFAALCSAASVFGYSAVRCSSQTLCPGSTVALREAPEVVKVALSRRAGSQSVGRRHVGFAPQ
jgi:hypothetical protein